MFQTVPLANTVPNGQLKESCDYASPLVGREISSYVFGDTLAQNPAQKEDCEVFEPEKSNMQGLGLLFLFGCGAVIAAIKRKNVDFKAFFDRFRS